MSKSIKTKKFTVNGQHTKAKKLYFYPTQKTKTLFELSDNIRQTIKLFYEYIYGQRPTTVKIDVALYVPVGWKTEDPISPRNWKISVLPLCVVALARVTTE